VAYPEYASGEQTLVTMGDVVVTPSWVITPSGSAPVGQTTFTLTDLSQTTRAIPTWAIVCAIIFFLFCFLGLLFLLAKEETTVGQVQITVQGPRLLHTVSVPVWSAAQVFDLSARVNYARSVAHGAG
jgi:hypothetical protein